MFILCDDDDGKILGFSKLCEKRLHFKPEHLSGNEVIFKGNSFTISDVIPMLDIKQIKNFSETSNGITRSDARVFEGISDFKFSYLST